MPHNEFVRQIIVKPREERNSEQLYAKIHLDALREAMKTLNGSGLKLWLFLNKNQDNFTVNITPSSCQRWGIKKDSYYSGINELIEKNYLVKVFEHDSVYYFYETSIPDSEKPKWFSEDNSTNITANKNGIKEEK